MKTVNSQASLAEEPVSVNLMMIKKKKTSRSNFHAAFFSASLNAM